MKLGRLNHIGVATPSIADSLSAIASAARQSSALVGPSGLLRRYAPRNDYTVRDAVASAMLNHYNDLIM
jgi:hypothetical protein